MKLSLSVVSLIVVGCFSFGCAEGSDVLRITADREVYDETVRAANNWMQVCKVGIVVSQKPGGTPLTVHDVIFERPKVNGFTELDGDNNPIRILILRSAKDRPGTIAHEIGHALGVGHKKSGLMRPPHEIGVGVAPSDCEDILERYK